MTDFRSPCPITSSLDIVGDKWTLVLLRSMAMGARSYSDFLDFPEKIATNILATRLASMKGAGLIEIEKQSRGRRRGIYRLTPKGADLLPVLQALARWGETHIPDRWAIPDRFRTMTTGDLLTED